jgi:multifunctional methyltransferase subunit TRM112
MKPFMLGILKCKRCTFMQRLGLICNEAICVEISASEPHIFNKHMYQEDSGERLKMLAHCLNMHHSVALTEQDIESFVEDPSDDAKVKAFLFGIDIISGALKCESCGLQYPIKNSIVDTVDAIESN